jgi:hypothetical protein
MLNSASTLPQPLPEREGRKKLLAGPSIISAIPSVSKRDTGNLTVNEHEFPLPRGMWERGLRGERSFGAYFRRSG